MESGEGMQIGVIGVNHKSANLELRESLTDAFQRLFQNEIPSPLSLPPVLISTCNRTELYFVCSQLPEAHTKLLQSIRSFIHKEFEHALYSYFGKEAFLHLVRVTTGLDSAILGETEIQGQIKKDYEKSCQSPLPKELHFAFQKALKIGKQVRTKALFQKNQFHH